jgi:hypothetical protein
VRDVSCCWLLNLNELTRCQKVQISIYSKDNFITVLN